MPGYVKSVLDQIMKFQDPTNKASIGEILCPSQGVSSRKIRINNFEKDLLQSGKLKGSFSDIFDLGDLVGTELSELLNLGGVFVSEFFEDIAEQMEDNIELGLFRDTCQVEFRLETGGLAAFL